MDAQRHSTKVAIVTGAASGIGRATAVRLAHEAARVVASDINVGGLDEVRELIRSAGADATAVAADIGLQADIVAGYRAGRSPERLPEPFAERLGFHRAASTLRIARNGWLSPTDRLRLLAQGLALLT